MNAIYQDTDSRYTDVDNNFCVFVTPRQVSDLGIGLPLIDYKGCEDDVQPFVVDSLVEMAREYILGAKNGKFYRFPVENSSCCVTLCLDINGKLCRLQREELGWPSPFTGLPLSSQVKTFQRLLNEKRIDLSDLAAADVDLEVYKQLCINDTEGEEIWQRTLNQIANWILQQRSSKKWGKYFKPYENSPKMLWWEEMAFDTNDSSTQI